MSSQRNICLTAADGQTGHLIAELLLSHPDFSSKITSLTCLALNPEDCSDLTDLGANVIQHTPGQPQQLIPHLQRVDTVMLIPPSSPQKVAISAEMVEAVKAAGVANVVLLSAAGCDFAERDKQPRLREFVDIEGMVMPLKGDESTPAGKSQCIIRAGFYAENILLYGQQAREKAMIPIPINNQKFPPVALGDVALLAAHILTGRGPKGLSDAHRGQLIVVTGPKLTSGDELAADATKALGAKMEFVSITEQDAVKILSTQTTLDPSEQEYLLNYYSLVREGKTNYISTAAFIQITGVSPTQPEDFFRMYPEEFKRRANRGRKNRAQN
ncbi:hypothetical protein B0H34DRAFT_680048 [Crassisporium funariophilum]|nr:hypothetical protein B0H34DRAFT_680048 [Crassisporium funariophilum]